MKFLTSFFIALFIFSASTTALADDSTSNPFNGNQTLNQAAGSSSSGSAGSLDNSNGLNLNNTATDSSTSSLLNSGTGSGNSLNSLTSLTSGGGNSADNTAMSQINQICGSSLMDSSSQELKIFSVGVQCFETITSGLAETTIQSFSSDLAQIVYVVLVLYVIFFGVKVASGITAGPRLKGEAIMGAIKIAVVAWLVYGFDNGFNILAPSQPGLIEIYEMVISSYHSLLIIVLPQNGFGGCASGSGIGGSGITLGSQGTAAIWDSMDCMFSKFIGWNQKNGYATGNSASNYGGVALLFGFISSKILPANGFVIGGLLFSTLMTLMLGFFRLAFVYILSMIAMILLFSIGPLMVPLMLFERTKGFFDAWIRLIIGMILQPVILFAFFSFVGGLLSNTIQQMEQLFTQMKPSYETSNITTTGDQQTVNPSFVMNSIGNAIGNMDTQMVLNGVVTLVIAYLLVTFIKFVGTMAAELAGTAQVNLQGYAPKFAGGGGGE